MSQDEVLTDAEVNEALDLISSEPVLAMQNVEIKSLDALHTIRTMFDVLLWRLVNKWRGDSSRYFENSYGHLGNIGATMDSFSAPFLICHFNVNNTPYFGGIVISDFYLTSVLNRSPDPEETVLTDEDRSTCKVFFDELIQIFQRAWNAFIQAEFQIVRFELSPKVLVGDKDRVYRVINHGKCGNAAGLATVNAWWLPLTFVTLHRAELTSAVPGK